MYNENNLFVAPCRNTNFAQNRLHMLHGAHLEPSAQEFKGHRKQQIVYKEIEYIVIGKNVLRHAHGFFSCIDVSDQ
jgi:hypothetical protein